MGSRSARYVLPIGLIVVGAILAVVCGIKGVSPFVDSILRPTEFETPGKVELRLSPGTYMLYERTGTQTGAGGVTVTDERETTLSPFNVAVTGANGRTVSPAVARSLETLTRGSRVYTGAVEFEIAKSDRYTIEVSRSVGRLLVSRSLGSTFGKAWRWFVGAVAGALAGFAGVVLLIVLLVSANRKQASVRAPAMAVPAPVPMAMPTAPPPGWYPDPEGRSRLRYWDGRMWTQHRA